MVGGASTFLREADIAVLGMNDVLPKPFTKEGLLNMLEKHLGHLKKLPEGIEIMPNTASTMVHTSTPHSIKDESSPGQSPSTVSNWQSPGQFSGISPTVTNTSSHFMQPVHTPTGYGIDHSAIQFQPPQTPLGAPPRGMQHRRQASEMTGIDDIANDPKRPRIYAQTNAAMNQMQRRPV